VYVLIDGDGPSVIPRNEGLSLQTGVDALKKLLKAE